MSGLRSLRWRAALSFVGVLLVIAWVWMTGGTSYIVQIDFNMGGNPPWYPTRTLDEWETTRALWVPWVFREPGQEMDRPQTVYVKRKQKKRS